jgi:uncharacterized protein (TIGR02231 family)
MNYLKRNGVPMTDIQTKIAKVILYPSTARVTRTAAFHLPAGDHEVQLQAIPGSIDSSSVSVNLKTTSQAVVLRDIAVDTIVTALANREELAKLEAEIKDMGEEIESARQRLSGAAAKISHIDGLLSETRNIVYALTQEKLSIEDHFNQVGQIDSKREVYIQEHSRLRVDLLKLEDELKEKKQLYQSLSNNGSHEVTQVKLRIETPEEVNIKLELSHLQYSCGWKPVYRASLEGHNLKLAYEAEVTQKTGEDWQEVEMSLSTSQPTGFRELPKLKPWHLKHYKPPSEDYYFEKSTMPPMSAPPRSKEDTQSLYVDEFDQLFDDLRETAEVKDQGVSMHFELPHVVSVPSKDTATKLNVVTLELPSEVDLLIVPKITSSAYRRVQLTNDSNFTLMPGKIALFFEGEYLGESRLELIPAGGKEEISFGSDQRVIVEREILQQEVNKKVLQDRNVRAYKYQIKITNPSNDTLKAEIQDNIPVSVEDTIKVRLESVEPKPTIIDELKRITWILTMAPQSKTVIKYEFEIDAPRDIPIAGLPFD